MRHRRGADLALDRFLPEVAHRDVGPHVAVEVDQDRVPALKRVEQLRHAVMRLDLDRKTILAQAETLDHAARKRLPIDVRIGGQMRVEVPHRAVHLGGQHNAINFVLLPTEPRDDDRKLLAERSGRGGLAMRVRQHRHGGKFVRHRRNRVRHGVLRGAQRLQAIAQHQRMGHVVDVFGRTRKMDKLAARRKGGALQLLLDEVFHRLHVMVGGALDVLDALRVG